MRIVAFSDYHNNGKIAVPDGDVLVVAGDICKFGKLDNFEEFISTLPHKNKLLVAGNHDDFAKRGDAHKIVPSMQYLQDKSVVIDGVKFYGSPWHSVLGMAFGATEKDMEKKWDEIPDDTDVLITHMPPKGILDGDEYSSAWGCPYLADRVYEVSPKLHIFGHIHMAHGKKSVYGIEFANVGLTNGQYKLVHGPTVIDI